MVLIFISVGEKEKIMRREREHKIYDRLVKNVAFGLFTVLLSFLLAMFVSQTVISQTKGNITVDEQHFQKLEQEYVKEIRSYMEEQGFQNSGVTLTRVVENGERSYEVVLHHKNLAKLTEEELEELFVQVEGLAFEVADCSFRVNLLG